MKFLNPAGLWLLLGIPVLIIIYLIKAQHEDRPVSSTYIWQLSSRFMKKRLPLQKLKKILTFVLQLCIITAVALLAARPAVETEDAIDYIIVVDTSASMQLRDTTGTSRMEYALAQAEELAAEIEKGHRVSVITASDTASCAVQESTSLNEVKLTLRNIRPTFGTCNLQEAMSLASLLCDHYDNPKVVFFTDADYEASGVEVVNLNAGEWNVSVTSLTARTSGKDTTFVGTLISYRQDTTVTVGLRIDGSLTDAQIIDCTADTPTEVVFTAEGVREYDTAEVFIETSDALAEDNAYVICRKQGRSYTVTLVSDSPLYLESALRALGNCQVTVLSSTDEADLTGQDLYVFDGIVPDEYPTDGSVLQFGVAALPNGITADDTVSGEAMLQKDAVLVSELYADLSLQDTVVSVYTPLTGNAYWQNVLFCNGSAVMASRKQTNGTAFTVVSFDVHDSNLPLHMDFVTLIRNVVEYSVPRFLKQTDYAVGGTVEFYIPADAETVSAVTPGGDVRTLNAVRYAASMTVNEVGVYTAVMETDEGSGEYVDFFVHIAAGDVADGEGGTLAINVKGNTDSGVKAEKALSELWFWIVLAVLLLILTEWGVYAYEQY